MSKKQFFCRRCQLKIEVEVLEPGEAEEKRIRPVPVRCRKCGGPVEECK